MYSANRLAPPTHRSDGTELYCTVCMAVWLQRGCWLLVGDLRDNIPYCNNRSGSYQSLHIVWSNFETSNLKFDTQNVSRMAVSQRLTSLIFLFIVAVIVPSESLRFSFRRSSYNAIQQYKWPLHRSSVMIRHSSPQPISDETMEEWLDDMIYCGDIEGYIRRRAKDVVSDDFREYLEERLTDCQDEDEKQVLTEITQLLTDKLRLSDGLADSGEVFESRLDKILFTSPNQRKAFIQENIGEMTPGLVDYIQKEIKETSDGDSKVVFASILQLIGQAKGADLLGNLAGLLSGADSSLGDQFAAQSSVLSGDGNIADAKEAGAKVGNRDEQVREVISSDRSDEAGASQY